MVRRVITAVLSSALVLAGIQACTSREVVGVVVGALGVQPPSATVQVGDSLQLSAVVRDDHGELLQQAQPTWSSSEPTVAAVDEHGVVRGLRAGSVEVTARFGSQGAAARVVVAPPPVFDFAVTESGGSTTVSEVGGQDELTVTLLTQPSEDVTIRTLVSDSTEVEVQGGVVTFSPSDWTVARTVTVVGVDDDLVDGDQESEVTLSIDPGSTDPSFLGAPPKVVDVLNRDDEVPGFAVSATGAGTTATEGGAGDSILVVLTAEPGEDVFLTVQVDDTLDAAVWPTQLTFAPADWDTPQAVLFTAVDDSVADGSRARSIEVAISAGSDATFLGVAPQTLAAMTLDDEPAGWTLEHTGGSTVAMEGGASDSISVTLLADPVALVVLDMAVDDPVDATISPSSLIFTAGGGTTQWVTFAAVDDPDVDGTRPNTIRASINDASDAAFLGLPDQTIGVATEDNDTAGYSVTEADGTTVVAESGGSDSFSIALAARPVTDVTFSVSSDDPTEVTVTPSTVTFTPSTWADTLIVTVIGVDDDLGDGDQTTEVAISVVTGSDPAFVSLPPQSVTVTTVDDDGVGFTVSETNGTVVSESGTISDAVAVRLNAVPTADVVLTVSSSDLTEMLGAPTTLTFTQQDGANAQAVVVTGVDDALTDGDVVSSLIIAVDPLLTLDASYDTVSARTVQVTTLDDETPRIVVSETGGSTVVQESGTSDAFTVILSAEPLTDVVLDVSSSDVGEAVTDSSTLTFTPATWSTPKTVVVTGVDDGIDDGDTQVLVGLSVNQSASDDAWDVVADEQVVVSVEQTPVAFTATESGGQTTVHESGSTDAITIALQGAPESDVVLTIASADPGEVITDSATVTFTPADWDTPRTVEAVGVADGVVDGAQMTQVTVSVDPSSDPSYASLAPRVVTVTTNDAQAAAFAVLETGGGTVVDEVGGTDTLSIVLGDEPLSPVVLNIVSADNGEVLVDSTTLTFTPADWSTPKTVVLAGVDDAIADGDQLTLVTISVVDGSSDDLWDGLPSESVVVTSLDVTAGFDVTETGGTTIVDESGTSDSFSVVLTEQPAANVVMTVTVSDPGELAVDSATLTFTPSNWSAAKAVTITGADDPAVDGAQVTDVTITVVAGSDPPYVGLPPAVVQVTTSDNDVAGFQVSESGRTTSVDESGTIDDISVVLTAQPLTDVTLTVVSADAGEVTPDSATLTFTPLDWDVPKTVLLTGVDDQNADGSQDTPITIAVDASSDAAFTGLAGQTVSVETTDDEVADFAITESGGSTSVTEAGSSDSFDVVLLSRPSSSVTLVAISPDLGEVTVTPSSVSFPPGQWNSPRTFTVTGADDAVADGNQVTLVLVAVDDASSNPVFADAPDKDVAVTTVDDEVPGFTIVESGGITSVDENGSSDTFTIVLDAQPASGVTLDVVSDDTGEVIVVTSSVSFTTSNWATPQSVTLQGVADGVTDGPQITAVTVSVDSSSDPIYAVLGTQSVSVETTDIN